LPAETRVSTPALGALIGRKVLITLAVAGVATVLSAILTFSSASSILTFAVTAVALAALASLVGDGTEQLGARLGPGATGILQSALGNLPELFISIFALRAGLVAVVQAALVGSILANSLLVLGIAFTVGGLIHGTQRFQSETPRLIALMTLLSVAAVTVPTFTARFHTPAASHEQELSVAVAIVLLLVFAASVAFILRGGPMAVTTPGEEENVLWPLWLTITLLALAGAAAAFVSDWFVQALTPATHSLGLSEAFTGLVIVAIAGNAVENVVGVQFAAQNRSDLALSVILNSSLQVALALIPALVLLSLVVGGAHLTLVLSPLLVVSLALTGILGAIIVYDGESTWIEGVALVGLYAIIAASFWWG
jgi:Ca2+:H+ antiporter